MKRSAQLIELKYGGSTIKKRYTQYVELKAHVCTNQAQFNNPQIRKNSNRKAGLEKEGTGEFT